MSVRIVRIETAGRDRRARRLVFDDGGEPRLTSSAALKELGLEEGAVLDRKTVDAGLAAIEPSLARDKAYLLLSHRDRTSTELIRRLVDCGYPASTAAQVVDHLIGLGIIDDERFASAWARSRAARGLGPRRIRQELRDKGVADDILGHVMEGFLEGSTPVQAAIAALRGARPADSKDRARLIRRLISRGHSPDAAIRAVDHAGGDPQADGDLDDFPC